MIPGDFNVWTLESGSRKNNAKVRSLLEAFTQLDKVLAYEGNLSTFQNGRSASIVEITFVSPALIRCVSWHVNEDYTHSDHQALIFELWETAYPKSRTSGWSTLDEQAFIEVWLDQSTKVGDATEKALCLTQCIFKTCDTFMPRKCTFPSRKLNYW